jgi:hypothetical protein
VRDNPEGREKWPALRAAVFLAGFARMRGSAQPPPASPHCPEYRMTSLTHHSKWTSLTRTEPPFFPARKARFFQSDPICALPGFSSRSGWTSLTRTGVDLFGRALTRASQGPNRCANTRPRVHGGLCQRGGGVSSQESSTVPRVPCGSFGQAFSWRRCAVRSRAFGREPRGPSAAWRQRTRAPFPT